MDIFELNDMHVGASGVYAKSTEAPRFEYSDGESTERLLDSILTSASDLTSESVELLDAISDWPTEYHLSSTRANLLRCLNLRGISNVLELGCGCGSISRYLGEQTHLQIDAIEGSPIRAALAAKRCSDLSNVRVATGNFNDIEFPEAYYDAVLFIGVLEYAGRFSHLDDKAAVLELLKRAQQCLKPGGVVIIAIENRLGLKYLMGANEDHYAVPDIGLADYQESTGIRTFDHSQWNAIFEEAGFPVRACLLPFPDYKIPHVVIDAEGDHELSTLKQSLNDVSSRDYCRSNPQNVMGERESLLWSSVIDAHALPSLANSFLFVVGASSESVASLTPNNPVTQFSNPRFAYLNEQPTQDQGSHSPQAMNKAIERVHELNQQLQALASEHTQLKAHAQTLEERHAQIEASFAWRLLRGIRRVLGRV